MDNAKFKWANYGWWTENGKLYHGVMPDHIVVQIKTPQWIIDQLNKQLYPEIRKHI